MSSNTVKHLPNILTMLRVLMIPVFIVLFLLPSNSGILLSLIVFIAASITDALDGYIARRYNAISSFGKLMDPLADKLLTIAAFVMLTVYTANIAFAICLIVIISRELAITGFRVLAVEKGVLIAADGFGKVKTVLQMLWIIFALLYIWQGAPYNILLLEISVAVVALVTALSGVNYIWQNRKVFL